MSTQRQLEREQDILDGELENGYIDNEEYTKLMNELEGDYRNAAHEGVEQALKEEFDKW